ncbi:hypothetical protein Tco_0632448 [Tanacetum coccineum]
MVSSMGNLNLPLALGIRQAILRWLDQVIITLASGDRGQGVDPHSLQGQRWLSPLPPETEVKGSILTPCKAEARLDQVVITLASGDRGQGFNPHSLQGRRSFSTFGRTGSSLSTLGRARLVQVVITIASEDRGQGFDPHSLQGRRSFSTFDRTGSSLSTLGRGIAVYVSTSPVDRERRYLDP